MLFRDSNQRKPRGMISCSLLAAGIAAGRDRFEIDSIGELKRAGATCGLAQTWTRCERSDGAAEATATHKVEFTRSSPRVVKLNAVVLYPLQPSTSMTRGACAGGTPGMSSAEMPMQLPLEFIKLSFGCAGREGRVCVALELLSLSLSLSPRTSSVPLYSSSLLSSPASSLLHFSPALPPLPHPPPSCRIRRTGPRVLLAGRVPVAGQERRVAGHRVRIQASRAAGTGGMPHLSTRTVEAPARLRTNGGE